MGPGTGSRDSAPARGDHVSYDFSIEFEDGKGICPAFSDTHPALSSDGIAGTVEIGADGGYVRCGNYTSNVNDMWTRCLTAALDAASPARREGMYRLRDLDGRSCRDLAPLLAAAVAWGINHIDDLHALDPPNGWGDAEGAVTYLWDIQRMCEQNPDGRLRIGS